MVFLPCSGKQEGKGWNGIYNRNIHCLLLEFPPATIAFGHNLCSFLDIVAKELKPFISSNGRLEIGLEFAAKD